MKNVVMLGFKWTLLVCLLGSVAFAQTPHLKTPDGESIFYADIQTLPSGQRIKTVFTTKSAHAFFWNAGEWQAQPSAGLLSVATYPALTLRQITSVTPKVGSHGVFYVLTDDGTVLLQTDSSTPTFRIYGKIPGEPGEQFFKVSGDGRFVLGGYYLYDTDDSGAHWSPDPDPNAVIDVVIDQSGTAFKTNGFIQKRQKDSSTWQALKGPYSSSLYASHLGYLFSLASGSTNSYLSFSSDGGTTWHIDTAGTGPEVVISISDDASGTLYLLTSKSENSQQTLNHLYKQSPPYSAPWQKVNISFAQWLSSFGSGCVNSIDGDSILCAATNCGLLVSSDRGDSWISDNAGIAAEDIHAMLQMNSGALVASTNSGIFKAARAGANWTKIFPDSITYPGVTYRSAVKIFVDAKNVLYAEYELSDTAKNSQPMIYLSRDEGASWSLDTSTLRNGEGSPFYVDRNGYEYFTIEESFSTIDVCQRTAHEPWTLQFAQATNESFSGPSYLACDKQGSVYLGITLSDGLTGTLFQMSNHDGNWIPYDFDLSGAMVSGVAEDHKRNVYLGSLRGGLFRQQAGSFGWNTVTTPHNLSQGAVTSISIDSTDGLIAAFTVSPYPATNIGNGVYREDTTDVWRLIGGDSSTFTSLVTFGDTTYGLTGNQNGIYIFTSQGQNSVRQSKSLPQGVQMDIDHTREVVHLQTAFATPQHLSIKLIDVLGRELRSQEISASAGEAHYQVPLYHTSDIGFIIVHSIETGEQWIQKYLW